MGREVDRLEERPHDELFVKDALAGHMLAQLARIVLAEETLDSVLSTVIELTKHVDPCRRRGVFDARAEGWGGNRGYTGEIPRRRRG